MSSCTLENLTTGERFSYSGTLPPGITLEVDCDLTTVKNNGVDDLNTTNFTGDFLKLVPGTNYFKITATNNVVRIDWFDKWL